MKLGKLQKFWIEQLRKHPERQITELLGFKTSKRKYRACCLGEAFLCYYRMKKKETSF